MCVCVCVSDGVGVCVGGVSGGVCVVCGVRVVRVCVCV